MQEQSMPKILIGPRLRPIGDHIKDSLILIYKQWAPLLIAQAIIVFGSILVVIFSLLIFFAPVLYGLIQGMEGEEILKHLFSGFFWVGLFFVIVPIMIIASWGYATMIAAMGYRQEKMAPIGTVLKKGLQLLPPMLLLTVITTGAIMGASLMLIFPAIILCVGLSLAWYIRVLEDVSITQAIGTSWEITKGCKWSIFGRLLLLMLMTWGVLFTLALISMIPIMGLIAMPVQFALNFIITPYIFAYFFCIYDDLRSMRKDIYPLKGGLSAFMIISWVLAVAAFSGFVIGVIYLLQTYL